MQLLHVDWFAHVVMESDALPEFDLNWRTECRNGNANRVRVVLPRLFHDGETRAVRQSNVAQEHVELLCCDEFHRALVIRRRGYDLESPLLKQRNQSLPAFAMVLHD